MKEAVLKAYAKINLGLDITGKRADGYHLIKTVMQTVNLYDVVTVTPKPDGQTERIKITSNSTKMPVDETNFAYRAAQAVMESQGIEEKICIHIEKHIPMAAGLAGGSTDGAAVIKALNEIFGLEMTQKAADEIAVSIGADVPFCLRQGTWLCEGIGELLTELTPAPKVYVVITKPDFEVSTKWCYDEYDRLEAVVHPGIDRVVSAINSEDPEGMCANLGNVLEFVTGAAHKEVRELKEIMRASGACGASMSGSGGTVFGLFKEKTSAEKALVNVKNHPCVEECILTEFV